MDCIKALWVRGARTLAVASVASGLLGCRSPDSPGTTSTSPEAVRLYNRGVELEGAGRDDQALRSYRDAIASTPEFVEAHRAYQNLMLARNRRGDLLAQYRDWQTEAPSSAPRQYLLGRLWSDRTRQLKSFEEARWNDPKLLFANIGVGYTALDLGDVERSRWAFRRATELAPERVEPRHGLLLALSARPDPRDDETRAELVQWLSERDPHDPVAQRYTLMRMLENGDTARACAEAVSFVQDAATADAAELAYVILDRSATNADFLAARDRLAPLDLSQSLSALRLGVLVDEHAGDPAAALYRLMRASAALARDPEVARMRQRLLLKTGQLARFAQEVYTRRFGTGLRLDDGGVAQRSFDRALAVLRESARPVGAPAMVAADALMEAGLHEPAVELLRASLNADPTQLELESRLRELLRHQRFLGEIKAFFEREYVSPDPMSFDDVMDELREISRASLGENVIDPVVTREFFPIGVFLDPDPEQGCGLSRYFDRFGMFALVGQRLAAPAEAYVMRRIAANRPVIDGTPVYRVVGEELAVPSRVEFFGAEIAGFAFQSFIALNADRVRHSARRAEALFDDFGPALLDDALLAATEPFDRADVSEPLTVAVRAHYRALERFLADGGRREEFAGVLLDAVEAHERAHIRDASRFLPILRDLSGKLRLLWRHRFSVPRVEAWLEARAQAVAFAEADSPMAVLSSTVYFLPGRDSSPPHSVGYYDLAQRLVAEVERNPQRYPVIDRRFTILPQLDRLTDDELRELGRNVLREYDD